MNSERLRRSGSQRWRKYPFEIVRPLGKGAMGSVLEVKLPGDPRRLAAKILTRQTGHARERFRREGELMSRLRHPGIVSLHSAGVLDDESPYLIFDLVEGLSLHEVLAKKGTLTEDRAVSIAADLAEALGHAHEAGIVHRDVKPSNVLIDAGDGRPRLTDFGIALAADQDRLTKTGGWAGTPLYMAPEQLNQGQIGPATDLYALGAVLFQLLTGQPPFDDEQGTPLVPQILNRIPQDVRKLRPDVSRSVAAIVARLLEKDPTRRYGTGASLAADLRAVARGESLSSGSNVQQLARGVRRVLGGRAVRRALLAGFVLIAAAGVGALWFQRARLTALTELAERLDRARVGLRQAEVLDSEHDDVQRLLAEAEALLEATSEGQEHAILEAARGSLFRARGQRRALDLLAKTEDSGSPETLAALSEAFAAVPAAVPEELTDRAERRFEEERGGALLRGGRLEQARASLEVVLEAGRPRQILRDSPAHWLAWVELGLGQVESARGRLVDADAALSIELELARAWQEPGAAGPALEAARQELPATQEPERGLLASWIDLLALGDAVDEVALLGLLERVRTVADPARPGSVQAGLQGRASLLEGELSLRLGWPASAAVAFARALALLPPQAVTPWVGQTAKLPDGSSSRLLLPPRHAAGVGLALARGRLLESEAALESSQAAVRWAALTWGEEVKIVAAVARAEALSVAYLAEEAQQALAGLGSLGAEPDLVAAVTGQLARRRGERVEVNPLPEAPDFLAQAEAELESWYETRASNPDDSSIDRARRGYMLAVAGETQVAARAWSGLARVHLVEQDPEDALQAAHLGATLLPDDWLVAFGLGLARAFNGDFVAARADLQRAIAGILRGETRWLETVTVTQWVLLRSANLLAEAGDGDGAMAMWDAASRHSVEQRLPGAYQLAIHTAAIKLGQRSKHRRLPELRKRLKPSRALYELHAAWYKTVRGQWAKPDLDTEEEMAAIERLVEASPAFGYGYSHRWALMRRMRPEGYHDLALGVELTPIDSIDHMEDMREGIVHTSLLDVLEKWARADPQVDGDLTPADPDLQIAVTVLMGKMGRIELEPRIWFRGLRAAKRFYRRRPQLLAASLILGGLLLEIGDPAGAIPYLQAATRITPVYGGRNNNHDDMVGLYLAQAFGALRDWEGVRKALEPLHRKEFVIPELERDPRFCEDRSVPEALHQVVLDRIAAMKDPR